MACVPDTDLPERRNRMAEIPLDLLTAAVGFLLTLMVLSYLIGDNPLFRMALYLFVGTAAGYVASVAWHQVLWPKLLRPFIYGSSTDRLLTMVPLLLSILLVSKLSFRTARFGNPAMAFLVGAGAAVAIGGALLGTLFPQTRATLDAVHPGESEAWMQTLAQGAIMVIGTVTTLIYFNFGARSTPGGIKRSPIVNLFAWIGQFFIAITFGVLFAGVFTAALTALIERLTFIADFFASLF